MALLDNIQRTSTARPRTGLLFLAVVVGHVILISSQVQSRAGVPVLEGVTFGAFARVQQGTAHAFKSIRNCWSSYVDLRGVRIENATLRSRVADLEIRLQEQRALALRSEQLQALLDLRPFVSAPTLAADVIAGYVNPSMLTVTIDKGSSDGVMAEHGGDLVERGGRAGDWPGGGARGAGAAADRPQRSGGGRRADRADPGGRHGDRQGRRSAAAHGFRVEPGGRETGRRWS